MPLSTRWVFAAMLAASLTQAGDVVFMPQNDFQPISGQGVSVPMNLGYFMNNKAFGASSRDGSNFDNIGGSYPSEYLPPANFTYNAVNYHFNQSMGYDNVIAQGQSIFVPKSRAFAVYGLAAAESSTYSGTINATYADGTTSSHPLLVPAWWSWPYPSGGDLVFPYRLTNSSVDYNRSNIFQTVNWLDSSKELVSLTLPNTANASNRLHFFALSFWPLPKQDKSSPQLEVQYARSTQKWIEGTNKTQIVEVLVNNVGQDFVLRNHSVCLTIESPGLETVSPGTLKRLRPGDQALIEIGVINKSGVRPGSHGNATVLITGENMASKPYSFDATYGIGQYQPTYESIYTHESPNWFNNAKYGIFIHWGVYSVPGWGNTGKKESYAEWYWYDLNLGPGTAEGVYEYHEKKYGPHVVYDDFIQNFTASAFDPKEWVDLFADAGANYFVQVSKHHDGYALFDLPANVSKRTSVALHPHRNLLQELFNAAKLHQPHLHRATYYSLPEWFNPAYKEYGFGSWPGGNATNPFTNHTLPYTGWVPVSGYVEDVILPEMKALADMGTELMWCDIGGPNRTIEFAAEWYNQAAAEGRQVTMNSRCGLPGDFDTPEYATFADVQARKWESSEGMDPFSYGYNRATPASEYANATAIVQTLVDIVSKNGNFLLDVGPQANGTIIDVEQRNLRQAGAWIKAHAEAIYSSRYWFVAAQEGPGIRFTTAPDAFYILNMRQAPGKLVLDSPVPWVPGDRVTIVGGSMAGHSVPARMLANGSLELDISQEVVDADQYTWVYKIAY